DTLVLVESLVMGDVEGQERHGFCWQRQADFLETSLGLAIGGKQKNHDQRAKDNRKCEFCVRIKFHGARLSHQLTFCWVFPAGQPRESHGVSSAPRSCDRA